jgi:branched-chain amino acid transport system permease protein
MIDLVLQQCLNGLVLACNYTLFALGLSVIWGVLKVLNLAHAELFTFGALAAVYAGQMAGVPLPIVVAAAILTGGLLSVVVDTIAFWPLRMKNLSVEDFELTSLITSLGASTILISVASHITGNQAQSVPPGLFDVAAWRFGPLIMTNVQLVVSLTALALTLATWWVVRHSQFGRALRALAFSTDMARVVGIRTEVLYRATLFACGSLAAVAGVLLTILMGSVNAYSGADLMLKAIAIIVLAGNGAILGLFAGALILGFGETVGTLFLPTVVQSALPFLVILIVLLARPSGLFGRSEAVRT